MKRRKIKNVYVQVKELSVYTAVSFTWLVFINRSKAYNLGVGGDGTGVANASTHSFSLENKITKQTKKLFS